MAQDELKFVKDGENVTAVYNVKANLEGTPDAANTETQTVTLSGKMSADGKSVIFDSLISQSITKDAEGNEEKEDKTIKLDSPLMLEVLENGNAKVTDDAKKQIEEAQAAASGAERGTEDGVLSRMGEFAGENKWGLGAGLLAGVALGALAGGNILMLILALLAAILIGGLVGSMMDKNSAATPLVAKVEDKLGLGRGHEISPPTPGLENAIDVKEGDKIALKNKDGHYLSGRDENGNLTYSPTPQPVNFRILDAKGNVTGAITGEPIDDGAEFKVTSSRTALPDGRLGPEISNKYRTVDVSGDGSIDFSSDAMKNARDASVTAATKYAEKAPEMSVSIGEDKSASAAMGSFKRGEQEYNVIAQGKVEGGKVSFENIVLRDKVTGELVKDINNDQPMTVPLPDGMLQNLAVSENKTIAPMSGDINKLKDVGNKALETRTQKLDDRSAAMDKELDGIKQKLDEPGANKVAIIETNWQAVLETAGIEKGYKATMMAKDIAAFYQNGALQNDTADAAALRIVASTPGAKPEIVREFAGRTHEMFSKAIADTKVSQFDLPGVDAVKGQVAAMDSADFRQPRTGENFIPDTVSGNKKPRDPNEIVVG